MRNFIMKYELTTTIEVDNVTLYQIQALKDFGDIKVGDVGGWIETESNLSQDGNAWVSGDASVYGDALVYGDARVYDSAIIAQNQYVKFNRVINDLTDRANLLENIEAQTGLAAINGEIYCYKHVGENLSSLHDADFKYVIGDYVSVDDVDLDETKSCTTGLHVSNAQYWNGNLGMKRLFCKVSVDDIIAVQNGKIRCKRLFVIGVCDGIVF
jgi:hypothetical protein